MLQLTTKFETDAAGKITKSTDPRGLVSTYTYDLRGLITQKTTPDAGTVQYLYDKNGNLRLLKDANHTSESANYFNQSGYCYWESMTAAFPCTLNVSGKIALSAMYDDGQSQSEDGYMFVRIKGSTGVTLYSVYADCWSRYSSGSFYLPKGVYTYEVAFTQNSYGDATFWHSGSCTTGLEFVYNKYDKLNRLTEVGEYESNSNGSFTSANAQDTTFPSTGRILDKTYLYDAPTSDPLAVGQKNLSGRLSAANSFNKGTWIWSTFYSYNELGQVEWIVQKNQWGRAWKITYAYDLRGNLLNKSFADIYNGCNLYTFYEYDQPGRLINVYTGTSADGSGKVRDANYVYNPSGGIRQLQLGTAQSVDYSYNSRDWLTRINDVTNVGSDIFAERVSYYDGWFNSTQQFNGNIASTEYYNSSLGGLIAYAHGYDRVNRLTSAQTWLNYGSWYATEQYKIRSVGYDNNGNISSMSRFDKNGGLMDTLAYSYPSNANKLNSIYNQASRLTWSYAYDPNGNATQDSQNGIGFTIYNVNNLPVTVYKTNGPNITYSYDANNSRIYNSYSNKSYVQGADGNTEAIVDISGPQLMTHNILGNGNIGKIARNGGTLSRFYYLKDHLGSIRMTVDVNGSPVSYDHYDPWGLVLDGMSWNNGQSDASYKFTGKEKDVETNLQYFGARYYDARVGRWMSVDPMATSPGLTPYHYTRDSPTGFVDPDGQEELRALKNAQDMIGLKYKSGLNYGRADGTGWSIKNCDQVVCNELSARAYFDAGYTNFPAPNKSQIEWFEKRGAFYTNGNIGEKGDVIYFQKDGDKTEYTGTHSVIITGVVEIDGLTKYTFVHAGASGSVYDVMKPLTIKELVKLYAGDKKFLGIGSLNNSTTKKGNGFYVARPDATFYPIDFKEWASGSGDVYRTINGEIKIRQGGD